MTAVRKLDDAAPANVRVTIGLRDLLPVLRDVVEDDPFTQRQIAQRNLGRAESLENLVEQNGARDREVGAARLEPWHSQALVETERHELLARAVHLLRGDAAVAQRRARRVPLRGGDHAADAQNRARRADHALESCGRDLIEVLPDFVVDVASQPALVPRLDRIGFHEPLRQPDDAELEAAAELHASPGTARHFHAAAADVDDDRDITNPDAVHGRRMDEPGFLCSGDDTRPDSCLIRDSLQKLSTVFRLARRARCHGDHFVNTMGFGQSPEFR